MLTVSLSEPSAASSGVTHTALPNGMQVVVIPDRRAPVVTHMVWYKVGAADEPRGKSGIAHFLEHLMFKGTEKIAPGEFSKIVSRNGGQDNAFTSTDATAYFQRVAPDRLKMVMEMEADRMTNLLLKEQDVVTELKVILEERRSRVDNDPSSIISEQMGASMFIGHPYRIPVIGWDTEIRGLTHEDAMSFYQRFYAPNNAILVVAGDVEPDAVIGLAKEIYGPLKPSEAIGERKRPLEPEPQAARRVILKDSRVGKETLSRHYLTPSYRTGEGREPEALELLAAIIGSQNTGRLHKKLVVEEKKASGAGAWYSGDSLDYGRIGFYAISGNDTPLKDIEVSIDAVIEEVRQNGVTKPELERVRNSKIADFIYEQDSQFNMARIYGWALVTGRTVEDIKDRARRLEEVTLEDIQAAAKKYFDPKRSVSGELLSTGDAVASSGAAVTTGPSGTVH
jgi:zinc protease